MVARPTIVRIHCLRPQFACSFAQTIKDLGGQEAREQHSEGCAMHVGPVSVQIQGLRSRLAFVVQVESRSGHFWLVLVLGNGQSWLKCGRYLSKSSSKRVRNWSKSGHLWPTLVTYGQIRPAFGQMASSSGFGPVVTNNTMRVHSGAPATDEELSGQLRHAFLVVVDRGLAGEPWNGAVFDGAVLKVRPPLRAADATRDRARRPPTCSPRPPS